jgi:hypothetical protein
MRQAASCRNRPEPQSIDSSWASTPSFRARPRLASRPASSAPATGRSAGCGGHRPQPAAPRAHDRTDESGQLGGTPSFRARPRLASRPASSAPATGRSAGAAGTARNRRPLARTIGLTKVVNSGRFDHSSRAPASPGDPPARRPPRAAAPVRRAPPASGAPSRAR